MSLLICHLRNGRGPEGASHLHPNSSARHEPGTTRDDQRPHDLSDLTKLDLLHEPRHTNERNQQPSFSSSPSKFSLQLVKHLELNQGERAGRSSAAMAFITIASLLAFLFMCFLLFVLYCLSVLLLVILPFSRLLAHSCPPFLGLIVNCSPRSLSLPSINLYAR